MSHHSSDLRVFRISVRRKIVQVKFRLNSPYNFYEILKRRIFSDYISFQKLFEKDPEGSRGVGRPKTRWIDGVQSDLSALNIRNWKRTAQDRPTWINVLQKAKSNKWTQRRKSKVSNNICNCLYSTMCFQLIFKKTKTQNKIPI